MDFETADPAALLAEETETHHDRDWLTRLCRHPILTDAQESDLLRRAQAGDTAARDELVRCNMRLVVQIAQRHAPRCQSLTVSDLIAEGTFGLLTAIRKFDPAKAGRLSTYATIRIQQAMARAIDRQDRTIRLPVHVEAGLTQRDRGQTHTIASARTLADGARVASVASLDAPLADGADAQCLADVVPSAALTPERQVVATSLREHLSHALATLDARSRQVLIWRFGLDGDAPQTLDQIGQTLELSRERVRQIADEALGALRHPSRAGHLRSYLEAA